MPYAHWQVFIPCATTASHVTSFHRGRNARARKKSKIFCSIKIRPKNRVRNEILAYFLRVHFSSLSMVAVSPACKTSCTQNHAHTTLVTFSPADAFCTGSKQDELNTCGKLGWQRGVREASAVIKFLSCCCFSEATVRGTFRLCIQAFQTRCSLFQSCWYQSHQKKFQPRPDEAIAGRQVQPRLPTVSAGFWNRCQ